MVITHIRSGTTVPDSTIIGHFGWEAVYVSTRSNETKLLSRVALDRVFPVSVRDFSGFGLLL